MKRSARRFLFSALLSLLCILLFMAAGERSGLAETGAETAGKDSPRPRPPVGKGKTLLADRDGNGISDGLQERLKAMSPTDRVDVVVTFTERGHADRARKTLGPFRVKREFDVVPGFAATVNASQVRALARARGVFRVEEDFPVRAMLDVARSAFGITAQTAGSLDGSGVGICVVDTGIDPAHEQLNTFNNAHFVDLVNGRQYPYDDNGHGTHVAAIAAGHGSGDGPAGDFHGVAPGAELYAVKVLDAAGSGTESVVRAGIDECLKWPGVRIISLSLGSAGSSDGTDGLSLHVDGAVGAGRVVVVAAGNSGDGPYTVGSPGAAAQAVTVGAAAEHSEGGADHHSEGIYLAPFSSRGPTAGDQVKPDIVAPGVSVMSAKAGTGNGYVPMSGTSMATPFVSGTLALVLNAAPALTPQQVKSLLLSTARERGEPGIDNDWGAGLLDGAALLAAAKSGAEALTPFPAAERYFRTIPYGGEVLINFQIDQDDLGVPVAAAVTIREGAAECLYGAPVYCDLLGTGWAWAPDLDAELIHPNGKVVASSACPDIGNECYGPGRQETLHYLPLTDQDTGVYTIRIWPFADDADGATGSEVSVDLSRGPLPTTEANSPPVADDLSITVAQDSSADIELTGSDPDGDPLTFAVENWPVWGDLKAGSSSVYTYTPDAGYHGEDGFTYTAHDGTAASAEAAVSITVTPAETLPPQVTVTILEPTDNAEFESGSKITFSGTAVDSEGRDLTPGLEWHDGETLIGTGASFTLRGKKTLGDGIHTITAELLDSQRTTWSDSIRITVGTAGTEPPPSGGSLHISELGPGKEIVNGKFWRATATATVLDESKAGVPNATVNGIWEGNFAVSCVTDGEGICSLSSRNLKLSGGSVTFAVTGVTHDSLAYDEASSVTVLEVSPPQ